MRSNLALAFAAIASVLSFQNCSPVSFLGAQQGPSMGLGDGNEQGQSIATITPIVESDDVEGGHFDLDTATSVYAAGRGATNMHVHEYDDKFATNAADFFNLQGSKFDQIGSTLSQDEVFYVRVANADLSPRVALEINGVSHPISTVQHGPFSLSGVAGTTRLTSLRAIVATDAITNNGLVSTQTTCVRTNVFSADGRYRNGALIFQAIRSGLISDVDPSLGVARTDAALLWEATLFWHEEGGRCR